MIDVRGKPDAAGFLQQRPRSREGCPINFATWFGPHARAGGTVEHPLRNLETVPPLLLSGDTAAEQATVGRADLPLDQQLLTKQRVPGILDSAKLSIVGSVSLSWSTMRARIRVSGSGSHRAWRIRPPRMGGSSGFPYSAGFTTTTDVQHEQADEPSSHDTERWRGALRNGRAVARA
jgi:hypothetical protein